MEQEKQVGNVLVNAVISLALFGLIYIIGWLLVHGARWMVRWLSG